MRILYIIDSLTIGGAQMLLMDMIRAYRPQHEIGVAYFTPGSVEDDLRALDIPLFHISRSGVRNPLALLNTLRIMHRFQPDVVHTHLTQSDVVGQLAASLLNVPARVSSLHNTPPWRQNRFASSLMQFAVRDSQCLIAVSESIRDYVLQHEKYAPQRLITIENGIDLQAFAVEQVAPLDLSGWGIPRGAPVIGAIGRLEPQKAHRNLLIAAAKIIQQRPDVHLLIAGEGSLRETLQRQRDELGLQQRVIFTGNVREMPALIAALDVVAFASDYEGLPISLLEAMAMQRPVVSTEVGGLATVIENDVNGILVPSKNPTALATALLRVLDDPSLARQLGTAGYETVKEQYSNATMHRRILDVYRTCATSAATMSITPDCSSA